MNKFIFLCIIAISFGLVIFLVRLYWQNRADLQKLGSIPQAISTIIGILAVIIGWTFTNQQALERELERTKREQLTAVAEYLALAYSLKEDDSPELFRKANQMAWQLAIWLPQDTYRKLLQGLQEKDLHGNWQTLIAVRNQLLGPEAGDLGTEDAILHAPGIGKHAR